MLRKGSIRCFSLRGQSQRVSVVSDARARRALFRRSRASRVSAGLFLFFVVVFYVRSCINPSRVFVRIVSCRITSPFYAATSFFPTPFGAGVTLALGAVTALGAFFFGAFFFGAFFGFFFAFCVLRRRERVREGSREAGREERTDLLVLRAVFALVAAVDQLVRARDPQAFPTAAVLAHSRVARVAVLVPLPARVFFVFRVDQRPVRVAELAVAPRDAHADGGYFAPFVLADGFGFWGASRRYASGGALRCGGEGKEQKSI